MDIEKTIPLRNPVTLGDVVYDKLELREPVAGEIEKASSTATSSIGSVINLISIVGKVPRRVAEGLCQRDFQEAGDFLDSFSKAVPTTGETSLQS